VFIVLVFIFLLIGALPVILIADGPIQEGLVSGAMAVAVAIAARNLRAGEAEFLTKIVRPIAIVAAAPVIWMIVQLLPLKIVGLAHPIWDSAEAALGKPVAGGMTIDRGRSLVALCSYVSTVALVVVSMAAAVDRRRAELLLAALANATTFVSVIVIAHGLGLSLLGTDQPKINEAVDVASLGAILTFAAAVWAFERQETRRLAADERSRFRLGLLTCLIAFAACWLALFFAATSSELFAAVSGLGTIIAVVVIRRFGLGPWAGAALAAPILVGIGAVIVTRPGSGSFDVALAFAPQGPDTLVSITERMLTDAPWYGSGAGTFQVLLPIYREVDNLANPAAPTAAAQTVVEMGRGALWIGVMTMLIAACLLLRGALQRGRDSFYSAAGAGCVIALLLLSFMNDGVFSRPVLIIGAIALGLGFAQRTSRTPQ
jgi:hypothetical protein